MVRMHTPTEADTQRTEFISTSTRTRSVPGAGTAGLQIMDGLNRSSSDESSKGPGVDSASGLVDRFAGLRAGAPLAANGMGGQARDGSSPTQVAPRCIPLDSPWARQGVGVAAEDAHTATSARQEGTMLPYAWARAEWRAGVTPPELAPYYRPVAAWSGHLIPPEGFNRRKDDPVVMELCNAPAEYVAWIGRRVTLRWMDGADGQRPMQSTWKTIRSRHAGRLQALAVALQGKDVTVKLVGDTTVERRGEGDELVLGISTEPVLVSGDCCALVKVVGRKEPRGDLFLVRHYNPATKAFDGPEETVRYTHPRLASRQRMPHGKTVLSVSDHGWFLYGNRDAGNQLVVHANEPRMPVHLRPDEVVVGLDAALEYIHKRHWEDARGARSNVQTVVLEPTAQTCETARTHWHDSQNPMLVMQLVGGVNEDMGMKKQSIWTMPQQPTFGLARVVPEPLTATSDHPTGESQLDIEYRQVQRTRSGELVASSMARSRYMGELALGWRGTQVISEIIIKTPLLRDYDLGGARLSPTAEFTRQLDAMAARCRMKDDDGAPEQDLGKVLFQTLQALTRQVECNPFIMGWLHANPDHADAIRFNKLVALVLDMEVMQVNGGGGRAAWQQRATGEDGPSLCSDLQTYLRDTARWRSMMCRRSFEEIADILLRHGASLWVIRTHQVGGVEPLNRDKMRTTLIDGLKATQHIMKERTSMD